MSLSNRKSTLGIGFCRPCNTFSFDISSEPSRKCQTCSGKLSFHRVTYSRQVGRLIRELFAKHSLCLHKLAESKRNLDAGRKAEALALLEEAERLCRELRVNETLATVLAKQAVILCSGMRLKHALSAARSAVDLAKRVEEGCTRQPLIEWTSGVLDVVSKERAALSKGPDKLATLALDHLAKGRGIEAAAACEELAEVYREAGNQKELLKAINTRALALSSMGKSEEALPLFQEAETLCLSIGDDLFLATILGNQAVALCRRNPTRAVELLARATAIFRKVGDIEMLVSSLFNQASLLKHDLNRPEQALPLAREAYRLATENGYADMNARLKSLIESLSP